MATQDLSERIVAHLSLPALRESCNSVLRVEASGVGARLRECEAAFARLKEVEAAVAQLEQDKGDRRRSASLMALVADAERTKRELEQKLSSLAARSAGSRGGGGRTGTKTAPRQRRHDSGRHTRSAPSARASPDRPTGGGKTRVLKLNTTIGRLLSDGDQAAATVARSTSSDGAQSSSASSDGNESSDGSESSESSESSAYSDSSSDTHASIGRERIDSNESSEDSAPESPASPSTARPTTPAAANLGAGAVVATAAEHPADVEHAVLSGGNGHASDANATVKRSNRLEISDESDESSSESEDGAGNLHDWINELTGNVSQSESASHELSQETPTAEKTTDGKHNTQSLVTLGAAQECLAKVNRARSWKAASKELRKLVEELWNGPEDHVYPDSTASVIAVVIARVLSRWTGAAMSYLGIYQATQLAGRIDRLCEVRPELRSSLNWATTRVVDAATMISRNPTLQQAIQPFLRLVLDLDVCSPAHRCGSMGQLTPSIEAVMANARDPATLDQLALALRLVTSWVCTLPPELKTPANMRGIHVFRRALVSKVRRLPNTPYAQGVTKLMQRIRGVLNAYRIESLSKRNAAKPSTVAADKPGLDALQFMKSIRSLPPQERAERVDELLAIILAAFRVPKAEAIKVAGRLNMPIKSVVKWVLEQPLAPSKLERYQGFVSSAQAFAQRLQDEGNRAGLTRLVEPLRNEVSRVSRVQAGLVTRGGVTARHAT